jgi:hypothetical protein
MIERRAALLLPAALAACANEPPRPQPVEGPEISYTYLPPLRLDVASIEIDPGNPFPAPGDFGPQLRPPAVEAVRIMGRDRLAAAGTQNTARFTVLAAQVLRAAPPPRGGLFAPEPLDQLAGRFACRLEILGPSGERLGFCEAEARRVRPAEPLPAARLRAAESLMRLAMFDLNTEFEFQLRRALRPFLADGAPAAASPGPVQREELPPA